MRYKLLFVFLAVWTIGQAGCATGFRAGGPRRGVEAGAAVGTGDPIYGVQ